MLSVLTSILVAMVGLATGWISDDYKKGWRVRLAVLVLVVLVTLAHNLVVKRDSDFKYTTAVAGPPAFPGILGVLESAQSEIYIAAPFAAYGDFH